jgi:hypothetical protein
MRLVAFLRRRAATLVILCALGGLSSLGAQTTPNPDALPTQDEIKNENPLMRFEIVTLGSYPISLFYIGFVDGIVGYYSHGQDSSYLPWNLSSSSLSNDERVAILEQAFCLSLSIGLIDAFIHANKVKKEKRLREARIWATSPDGTP